MKGRACLILCLVMLGAFETFSYPQEEQESYFENHEESEAEDGDSSSYHDCENGETDDRVKRDVRRVERNYHRGEHARILNILHRLISITRHYENTLRLSHDAAVNRVMTENPNSARQVYMYVQRYGHLPSLPLESL